jgi:hypothetical protein
MKQSALVKKDVSAYVLQPNVISQAVYSLGTNARRLVAMAMSMISEKNDSYEVKFTVREFLDALGLDDGTKQRQYVMAAVKECMGSYIEMTMPNGDWHGWTWFTESHLETEEGLSGNTYPNTDKLIKHAFDTPNTDTDKFANVWDSITMVFNPKLGQALKEFKKAYSKLDLLDLGKLQSRYAIRFYELAMSYSGFAGKDGNAPGAWWFELSLDDIRIRFAIDSKKYKVTQDFRRRIIDNPIEEINAAHIGLRIEPAYIRRGKRLLGARFNCRFVKDGEPLPVTAATDTGKEDEELILRYSGKFAEFYAEAKETALPFANNELFHKANALKKLREYAANLPTMRL